MKLKNSLYYFQDIWLSHRWRLSSNNSSINGIVLMYHNITDDWSSDGLSCRCPIKVFEHYLDYYLKEGYQFISINTLYDILQLHNGQLSKFCVITFDDAPDNVFKVAYPILKKRNIDFAVFVSNRYVDWVNPETGQKYITKSHLRILDNEALCTIGAHSFSHQILRQMANSREDMLQNKEWLEQFLGHSIDYIAYPYGKHSSVSGKIQRQAKEIGFKMGFGTIDAPVTDLSSKSLFYLPRMINN